MIEDASDAFVCLPNASDQALLDDAFAAIEAVYMGTRKPWRATFDQESMFQSVVTRHLRRLARGLGISSESVFRFYIQKAMNDHEAGIPSNGVTYREDYEPWLHIGFPLPFENVTIETTEDGLDWLRFGEIGPIPFGFTGSIPSRVRTVCFKRTDDLEGYEVVFVGEEIDPAEGQML